MLKLRVLTAFVLGPFILWSVLTFSHRALAIELALILMLGAWEWARISGINNQIARTSYSLVVGLIIVLITYLIHSNINLLEIVLYITTSWWVISLGWLFVTEKSGLKVADIYSRTVITRNLLIGVLVLGGSFVSIIGMHQSEHYGAYFIFTLLILIWVADTAAYFSGKAFGKHKLAVSISPGKTWEGVFGALIATIFVAVIIAWYFDFSNINTVLFTLIAVVSIIFSVVGDLLESMFKRKTNVKDSSQILPGHGGILDRIDSLIAAAPFYFLGLLTAEIK